MSVFRFDQLLRSEKLYEQVFDKDDEEALKGLDDFVRRVMGSWVWTRIKSEANSAWCRQKAIAKLKT